MNNFHMREGKVEFRWKRWRNKKRQEVSSCLMVLFSGMVLLGAGGVALAGPTGGQITGGTGSINQTGPTTNIDQTSNVLNINWQDFSIGVNETVNFNQPDANALAINRVIGGVPSQLAGALNANGRVFILNSAGITFTGTSHVNVGALLATTAMTVNGDPTLAASYSGSGYGSVVNQGSIVVSNGGFAILAAPYVQNTGFIKADLGTIALAGTNQFTLDLSGTGLINFVVPAGTVEQIVSDGKALGVDNSGTLQARSGQVIISANVATQVVNAVVNLNGVVDADAFAPNGTGGSVLVTGAGDINIGGQVTARGDGAGAGGQIVTKAGGADAIEALAFVSAAGGAAGGKGGFVEVSAPNVAIEGEVRAGAGGSMLIDPASINIVTNSPLGPTIGGNVGELWLESHLQAGTAETFIASVGNVTVQALHNGSLAGGAGDLTLQANQNIIFKGVNDTIVTGAGDVRLTAVTGSIGAANGVGGHAFNIVSGGPGVSQAGDIVLNAGQNIFLGNVTVKSTTGASSGDRRAGLQVHAGHNIGIAGAIDVEASASGDGADASAQVNLFANGHIVVGGPVTVLANAYGSSGSVKAEAGLIAAESHAVIGNNIVTGAASSIHFAGAVDIEALAIDNNSGVAIKAAARAAALLAAKNVDVGGPATVKATASGSNFNPDAANGLSTGEIGACATLIAGDGTLNLAHGYWRRHVGANDVHFENAIDVEARAFGGSNLIGFIGAHASAQLYGVDIAVDGEATVDASAQDSGAKRAIAAARLIAAGSANSQAFGRYLRDFQAGTIAFGQGIDVEAYVNGGSIGSAADALAYAALVGNDITINGDASILAGASGHGATGEPAGTVFADAHLAIGTAILRRQDSANGFYESGGVPRNLVNNIHVDGAVDVEASVNGSHLGNIGLIADATADIRGGRTVPDSIVIGGPVTVRTKAVGTDVILASGDASLVFAVGSGKLLLPEHVLVDAQASGNDASVTLAETLAHFFSGAAHRNATLISSDGITVTSRATGNGGNDYAGETVFATASISAQIGRIHINPGDDRGSVLVHADASGFDMHNIIASDGAFLKSYSNLGTIAVNVPLSVLATAHGTGQGSNVGEILAVSVVGVHDESIDFSPGKFNKTAIDIEAKASGHSASDITANARALLGETFGNEVSVNGAVIVHADAEGSLAASGVHAVALIPVEAIAAQIRSVNIRASASGSQVGNDVTAFAALTPHVGSQGIVIGKGGIDVEARADGTGVTGSICAHAEASFSDAGLTLVNGATKILAIASANSAGGIHAGAYLLDDSAHNTATSEIFQGPIDVEAHADVGPGGASSAGAIATIDLVTAGSISILTHGAQGSAIKVLASADPEGQASVAVADAFLNVNAGGSLVVRGNVTVQAVALGTGSFSLAKHDIADAFQHLEGSSVTIVGNLRSLALADGSWSRADATVEIFADGNPGNLTLFEQQDPIAKASAGLPVTAFRQAHFSTSAVAFGPHNSSAIADIDIGYNGTLTTSRRPRHF